MRKFTIVAFEEDDGADNKEMKRRIEQALDMDVDYIDIEEFEND